MRAVSRPGPARLRRHHQRRRRWATLAAGLVLIGTGIGLAVALDGGGPPTATGASQTPTGGTGGQSPRSSDQQLADRVMLTQGDLPPGWKAAGSQDGSSDPHPSAQAQAAITDAFARCMGITDSQADSVLGGEGADQTATAASPVFEAPSSASVPGLSVELQTAAVIVRSPGDEQTDFAHFANPQYPTCAATAIASELQLGANDATGGDGHAGPATALVLALPTPDGEKATALVASFTVVDQSASGPAQVVPAEVEVVSLGSERIEAELQAFAIGGRIPAAALATSVATFQERVASAGRGTAAGSAATL